MKIVVDRVADVAGNLVFTITVSEPHSTCFGEIEKNIMHVLDFCKEGVQNLSAEDNKLRNDVVDLIHAAKEKTFMRVLDNLKFAIENNFRPKFRPICQEIYNWIQEHQSAQVKSWMADFDPQRTKYYFDNDPSKGNSSGQETEHVYEFDDDDDWEDEDQEAE